MTKSTRYNRNHFLNFQASSACLNSIKKGWYHPDGVDSRHDDET